MNKIAIYLLKGLMWALGSLPLGFNYAVGRVVSWFAEHTGYRRDVVLTNLSRSFPSATYGQVRKMAHAFYQSLGQIVAECLWFGACPRDGRRFRRSGMCTFTNVGELNRLHEGGRSVMLLAGHICNWELIGGFCQFDTLGVPVSYAESDAMVSYKRMKSPVWERVMKDNRTALIQNPDRYANLMETSSLVRYIAANHDSGKLFHMIADQYPYKGASGMDIDFMHQPTKTMTAAGRLAARYAMPVVYVGARRVSRGHYEYTFHTIAEDASKLSLEEIYTSFYDLLQQDIEAQPEVYLWSHKRWKKR